MKKVRYWVARDEAGIRHYVATLHRAEAFVSADVVKEWTISRLEARLFTVRLAASIAKRNNGYVVKAAPLSDAVVIRHATKGLIVLALLLSSCTNDAKRLHWVSGKLCSCEQRVEVGRYVAENQRPGMADDSDLYVDHLFAVGVETICDHRDSVLAVGMSLRAIGLQPCEAFYADLTGSPRP